MKKKKSRKIFAMLTIGAVMVFSLTLITIFNQQTTANSPLTRIITTETVAYESHRFYGESLHFETTTTFAEYVLVDMKTNKTYHYANSALNNEGILLAELPAGMYELTLDQAPIESSDFTQQIWYTVMRNGIANEVVLFASNDQLYLQVNTVAELPATVYDIVIDPGHGGLDSGAVAYGLYESEEVLEFSLVLAEYLTDTYGLKVKVTRETDVDPAGDDNYSLEQSPYYPDGRVAQVYQTQAKLVLSNHLNTTATGSASGFQIYSTFETTNTLALLLSQALQMSGLVPSLLESDAAMGEGTYKQVDYCEERVASMINCTQTYEDYFFMLRETGGISTNAQNLINYNYTYSTIPNYGAEAILIEYGFIDNYIDSQNWQTNWQQYAISIGDAIATYLNLAD